MPMNAAKLLLLNVLGGSAADPSASFTAVTSGAQTLTIGALTVSAATTVDWGDGSSDVYTGSGARTHNYAGAGTWQVRILEPLNVTAFRVSSTGVPIVLNSADVKGMLNVTDFQAYSLPAGSSGTFDSADVSAWRPVTFYLYSMPAGYSGTFDSADVSAWRPNTFGLRSMSAGFGGTFNSADVSAWRPSEFRLLSMPSGYGGTFDSADVSAWRPSYFFLQSMPSGYSGTFDSADVSAWRPSIFNLSSMPSGYSGTFDSADVSAWRPTDFRLQSMPSGYGGTFDSADVSAWRPVTFYLYSMPAGYSGTFDSADVSAWRPAEFYLYAMPSGYTFTLAAADFSAWTGVTSFQMQGNALTQAQVDAVLLGLYTAAQSRTVTGGSIILSGSNAAPSGTYAADCPPTTGKAAAYELLTDSCGVIDPSETWTSITVTGGLP